MPGSWGRYTVRYVENEICGSDNVHILKCEYLSPVYVSVVDDHKFSSFFCLFTPNSHQKDP